MAFYFQSLQVWQKAFSLAEEIHILLQGFPKIEQYALVDQMRRSSLSIVSNIAEGNGRWWAREYAQFLTIAKWSCAELATQILLAEKFWYIESNKASESLNNLEEINKMLYAMVTNNRK